MTVPEVFSGMCLRTKKVYRNLHKHEFIPNEKQWIIDIVLTCGNRTIAIDLICNRYSICKEVIVGWLVQEDDEESALSSVYLKGSIVNIDRLIYR